MSEETMSVVHGGRCLCGACAFTAVLKTEPDGMVAVDVCHCDMCRRWGAGLFIAVDLAEEPRFADDAPIGVYQSSEWAERGFCQRCGTGLFYRLRNRDHRSMPASLFEDQKIFRMTKEIFIDRKPDYYAFEGERPRLTEQETMEHFASAYSDDAQTTLPGSAPKGL